MACCYSYEPTCEGFAVSPRLECYTCYDDGPRYVPCIPRCPKVVYCDEKKPPKRPRCDYHEERECRPQRESGEKKYCDPCCQPTCKPVKTKYVMPCYRYEDGRIMNQPTVLMRRACEVACGRRKKPFIESAYSADPSGEVRRFHSEDEKGNCCYHYERKKPCYTDYCCNFHEPCQPCQPYMPCQPCQPCPPCPPCQPCQPCQPCHSTLCCNPCQPTLPCYPYRPCLSQPCKSTPNCKYVECNPIGCYYC